MCENLPAVSLTQEKEPLESRWLKKPVIKEKAEEMTL